MFKHSLHLENCEALNKYEVRYYSRITAHEIYYFTLTPLIYGHTASISVVLHLGGTHHLGSIQIYSA